MEKLINRIFGAFLALLGLAAIVATCMELTVPYHPVLVFCGLIMIIGGAIFYD